MISWYVTMSTAESWPPLKSAGTEVCGITPVYRTYPDYIYLVGTFPGLFS